MMKLGTLVAVIALVAASACGGGSTTEPGALPPSVAASFVADKPTPVAKNVAMAEGAKGNDIVTVSVTLTGTNGVSAATFEVVFDDTNTDFLGFTPGSVFEQGGAVPIYQVDDPIPGRIFVTVTRKGADGVTNISGTTTVLGLQFRVAQAGVYPLTIENSVVYDGQPLPQPIPGMGWFAGAVTGV